jgi:hypothetical protein
MARNARKAMADMRAMEEQSERTNPLDGRGATPSMGLSPFRGGRTRKPSPPPKQSEAYTQGLHLARHLGKLHGKGYAEDFHKGMSGSGILSSLAGMLGLGHEEEGGMTYRGPKSGGVQTGAYEGEGKLTITHGGCYDSFTGAGEGDEMEGSGPISSIMGMFGLGDGEHSESDEEKPKGGRRRGPKKVKKPLMEGDGRLARAKIVRKVMADKGCSMIEASKYVKEHNLYHK